AGRARARRAFHGDPAGDVPAQRPRYRGALSARIRGGDEGIRLCRRRAQAQQPAGRDGGAAGYVRLQSALSVRPRGGGDPGPCALASRFWVPAFAGTNGESERVRKTQEGVGASPWTSSVPCLPHHLPVLAGAAAELAALDCRQRKAVEVVALVAAIVAIGVAGDNAVALVVALKGNERLVARRPREHTRQLGRIDAARKGHDGKLQRTRIGVVVEHKGATA